MNGCLWGPFSFFPNSTYKKGSKAYLRDEMADGGRYFQLVTISDEAFFMTVLSTNEDKWESMALDRKGEDVASLDSSRGSSEGSEDGGTEKDADKKKKSIGFAAKLFKENVEKFGQMRNANETIPIYLTWCCAAEKEASRRLSEEKEEKEAKARQQLSNKTLEEDSQEDNLLVLDSFWSNSNGNGEDHNAALWAALNPTPTQSASM